MSMGYTLEYISVEDALKQITEYDYALMYNISSMELCKKDFSAFDIEECQEARFFSRGKELHIFDGEEGKKAVIVKDKDQEYIMTKKYKLSKKYSIFGKCILVNEYISYDEDGQLYVELTRLKEIQ